MSNIQQEILHSRKDVYDEVILNTYYIGNVPMKLKCKDEHTFRLETKNNNISIKVIDAEINNLNSDILYPLDYLNNLEAIEINSNDKNYCNDIIFNVFNYLTFLDKYHISFKYNKLFVIANIPLLDNAFWNGSYLSFGAGYEHNPLTSSMIVGHELTHAVIQKINDLNYQGHSGALNESFADIFGVVFEKYIHEHYTLGWELGSETGYILRNMKDPHKKQQPMIMYDEYYHDPSDPDDNGGIHINSGIPNHIFVTVSDIIGLKVAFHLFVKVLYKLKRNSDFKKFKKMILFVNSYHKYIDKDTLINILNEHIF